MKFASFMYIAIMSLFLVCSVFYKSIFTYFQQQYHIDTSIYVKEISNIYENSIAERIEEWRKDILGSLENTAIFENESNEDSIPQTTQETIPLQNESHKETQEELQAPDTSLTQTTPFIIQSNLQDSKLEPKQFYSQKGVKIQNNELFVLPNTQFLLIGDSLMQGIAMTLVSKLSKQGFKAKSLAKQSTGLTYPSFFDWQKTTKSALENNPQIAVLVVCLGANDPWNIGAVPFGVQKWQEIYEKRIQNLLEIAQAHNVAVVWYEVPALRKKDLNKKVQILNSLYKKNVEQKGGLFLHADSILVNGDFSAYLKNEEGKSILVRTPDGIHFTPHGSSILAQTLLEKIKIVDSLSDEKATSHDFITPNQGQTEQEISDSPNPQTIQNLPTNTMPPNAIQSLEYNQAQTQPHDESEILHQQQDSNALPTTQHEMLNHIIPAQESTNPIESLKLQESTNTNQPQETQELGELPDKEKNLHQITSPSQQENLQNSQKDLQDKEIPTTILSKDKEQEKPLHLDTSTKDKNNHDKLNKNSIQNPQESQTHKQPSIWQNHPFLQQEPLEDSKDSKKDSKDSSQPQSFLHNLHSQKTYSFYLHTTLYKDLS